MKAQGVEWLVLETTSHALAQHRDLGSAYSVAVMTNVTHEHLDYHGTFERYRDAKRLLFKRANRNKNGLRTGVINADDPSAELFASAIANPITYGIRRRGTTGQRLSNYAYRQSATRPVTSEGDYRSNPSLPGRFNVYNSLAAVGAGRLWGCRQKQIEQGIACSEGCRRPYDARGCRPGL